MRRRHHQLGAGAAGEHLVNHEGVGTSGILCTFADVAERPRYH